MTLKATDITVFAGRHPILDRVQLTARSGHVTAIVGPNGSGKTTLMRVLTGELRPLAGGAVVMNGSAIGNRPPWRLASERGVLPQSINLAFPFTVSEVVRMGLHAGIHATREEIVGLALSRVGLANYGHRYFQDLSGGEQQRAHLARVLAQVWDPVADGRPSWLFLDEPVSSLDIGHQLAVMQLARDYASAGGGVIAVMHDLNLTAMYSDRIILMCGGRVAAAGRVDEVLTDAILSPVYGCALRVNTAPPSGGAFILPQAVAFS